MVLPKARTAPVPRRPHQGMCHDSRTGKLTSQGAKDHWATSDLHYDPGQLRTGRHHPTPTRWPQAERSPGYRSCGTRTGQGAHTRPAHAAVDVTADSMTAALGQAATTAAIFTAHLETGMHPRYGESAVQVSNQCDVL